MSFSAPYLAAVLLTILSLSVLLLHRAVEAKKTEIELKPCQNLPDYQLKD